MSMTHPVGRRVLAVVAALALAVTTACSGEPERADTESLSDATADSDAAAEDEAADDDEPASAVTEAAVGEAPSEAAPADDPTGPPLASVTLPISFIEGGEMVAAVTRLDIAGELMRVGITFTASLPVEVEEVAIGAVLSSEENAPAAGISPEVIDPGNLKAYGVVAGAIPNGTGIDLRDGASHTIVFYYAAPQDPVETVDIKLSSQTQAIADVPFPSS